jgi:hypothetical protein
MKAIKQATRRRVLTPHFFSRPGSQS